MKSPSSSKEASQDVKPRSSPTRERFSGDNPSADLSNGDIERMSLMVYIIRSILVDRGKYSDRKLLKMIIYSTASATGPRIAMPRSQ